MRRLIDPRPLLGAAAIVVLADLSVGPVLGTLGPMSYVSLAALALTWVLGSLLRERKPERSGEEISVAALRFLSEASATLGASLDYEATLAAVARLSVPGLADWCAVDLVEPDGRLRRIAVAHTDPEKERFAWELTRRYPEDPSRQDGAYGVLHSGDSVLVPVITDEMLALPDRDPEYAGIIRALGLSSYIGVPLKAHGEVFGVLTLIAAQPGRHFTEADLRLAEALGQRAGVAVDNARRHQETVRSANMLSAVLAASPVGQAFVDRELRYVHVNPTLATLHGVPVADHIHRRIADVLPAWATELEPLHRHVFETGEAIIDREVTVPSPAGGSYELLVNCFPVRDADGEIRWVGVTKADVTERRRAERSLRESEARLRRVVESPLIGIGFYDRDGRVTGANRALADLLGYTQEEIAGGALRWDTNLTAPEFRHLDDQAGREVALHGASQPYEKDLLRKDGARVPVLAGGSRFDDSGASGVFFVLDLTERRRVLDQAQAAQRLEAVGRLAGGVAHEINNALQGVLGFNAFILRRLGDADPAAADAALVQQSAERAATITQQLLAYSRRQLLQQSDFDVGVVLREFAPILRQALSSERPLRIEVPDAPLLVHADRAQFEQVLLNLVLNARDAMPRGGQVTIRAVRRTPAPGAEAQVHVSVHDTGEGMDRETRARVFEPFFTTKPIGQGTGLGLSVVLGIMQQSGGQVWIDSEPGAGTTVHLALPEVSAPPAGAAPMAPSAAEGAAAGGGRERVLVVDDEPVVLLFVGALLREAGYDVLEAEAGDAALTAFAAAQREGRAVDLVLTDLVMPGLSGQDLGAALQALDPSVAVLYTSGYTDDEAARRGLLAAGAEFLAKPFAPEALLRRVRGVLDAR